MGKNEHQGPTELMLRGFKLLTVDILYCMPDYPKLLQEFIWQCHDRPPEFPRVRDFLGFWEREIEGKIHSVTVGGVWLMKPSGIGYASAEFTLH